ncbi:MAG: DUF192 domain-containing protein [Elusimicrobiales bacterium]
MSIIIVSSFFIIFFLLFFRNDEFKDCSKALISDGRDYIELDIADTPSKRTIGLMFVKALDPKKGMLFIFDDERDRVFWMKNTFVPLDIIFISSDFRINTIYSGIRASYPDEPDDKIPLVHGSAKYVVEISSGMSNFFGFKEGNKIDIRCFKKDKLNFKV